MHVAEKTVTESVARLLRAEGQIRGVIGMLESGRECAQVITQLSAVSRALDRGGQALLVASGIEQCLTAGPDGEDRTADLDQLRAQFLRLA